MAIWYIFSRFGTLYQEKSGNPVPQLVSTLTIERADMHHAGKFTCAPSYAKPDTVTVHVIDGELPFQTILDDLLPFKTIFGVLDDLHQI
jgi:hypothetical protein